MAYDLDARVTALETVLDKYIPIITKNMAKTKSKPQTTAPEPSEETIQDTPEKGRGPIGLILPAYDVPVNGMIRRATSETLSADPEFLEYMRTNHPDCFVQ